MVVRRRPGADFSGRKRDITDAAGAGSKRVNRTRLVHLHGVSCRCTRRVRNALVWRWCAPAQPPVASGMSRSSAGTAPRHSAGSAGTAPARRRRVADAKDSRPAQESAPGLDIGARPRAGTAPPWDTGSCRGAPPAQAVAARAPISSRRSRGSCAGDRSRAGGGTRDCATIQLEKRFTCREICRVTGWREECCGGHTARCG